MNFDSYWLEPGAVIPVDIKTTAALVTEIHRLRQALAQPNQEPVGYVTDSGKSAYILLGVDLEDDTPLYTAPPKKEWVGLSDEEKQHFKAFGLVGVDIIEAKLKEKNGG